jgi:hypothetical protein
LFVRAKLDHALEVARNIRESDSAELAALGISDVEARLRWALNIPGDVRAVLNRDGLAVAIFGCAEISPGVGSPWMLCAKGIQSARRFIMKHGKRRVEAWRKRWPVLRNATYAGNRMHHRFIEHCGFTWMGEAQINGHPFKVFAYV